jgi:hypothetical protein
MNPKHINPSFSMTVVRIFLITFTAILLTACAGQKNDNRETGTDISQKLDAPLRNLLADTDQPGSNELHDVLIQLSEPPDEETLKMIGGHELEIGTIVNAIVTARGTATAVRMVATEPVVVSISLSQKRNPLE